MALNGVLVENVSWDKVDSTTRWKQYLRHFYILLLSNQRRANKKEAMELDNEIESRLTAAQNTLTIQASERREGGREGGRERGREGGNEKRVIKDVA